MTSFKVTQWLREGIAAAKTGDAERARDLLLKVVDADEYNEQAWLWLSSVVDTDEDRGVCLENVLAINPHNNLAKAGLIHLRSRKAPAPPPPEPEPVPPSPQPAKPTSSAADQDFRAMPGAWRSQPQPPERAAKPGEQPQERLATATAPTAEKAQPDVKPKTRTKRRRLSRRSAQWLWQAAFSVVGISVVVMIVMLVLQVGPFDPTRRDYAIAMRPVLADYDAWWAGPYGALVNELNSFCGPTADGWRNRDVLLNCNRYPAVDCALLAAHCGSDVAVMQERVDELSQEARKAGAKLQRAFDAISPPEDISLAHTRFLACLQARVTDTDWMGELVRGGAQTDPDHPPVCQMFSAAEGEVRQYVGR